MITKLMRRPVRAALSAESGKFAILVALATIGTAAGAATQTVTLSVPGMNCAACPITVRTAISRVAGVSKAEVYFAKRQAVVTFDDTTTSIDALTRATRDAGYPSAPLSNPK